LRAVSRVGVILLILWAIGLGLFVKALRARGRPAGAMIVTLVSILEQRVITRSYDKYEDRIAVAALVRDIDRRQTAFFYTPHDSRRFVPICHLDAMWASLESGVPTIRGYSGNFPDDWRSLGRCTIDDQGDLVRLESALERWASEKGLALAGVDWIGGPPGWRHGRATAPAQSRRETETGWSTPAREPLAPDEHSGPGNEYNMMSRRRDDSPGKDRNDAELVETRRGGRN
jgi:hypothetical protein